MPTDPNSPQPNGFTELEFFVIKPGHHGLTLVCDIVIEPPNRKCKAKWSIGGSEGAILRHAAIEASEHYKTHVAELQKRMDEINAEFDARP